MQPIITLTTDFGLAGPYVAAMKGVILSINPDVRLIDITHSISPQNVRQAAMVLAAASPWFPDGMIHLAVIDPGVGTARRIVYAEIGRQRYVCPDNGLLGRLTLNAPPSRVVSVENPALWLPNVSATFHGRDIMAPVAAKLSLGVDPSELGPQLGSLVPLDLPTPAILEHEIVGEVIWIDDFGNLISNITVDMLAKLGDRGRLAVVVCGQCIDGDLMNLRWRRPPGSLMRWSARPTRNRRRKLKRRTSTFGLGCNASHGSITPLVSRPSPLAPSASPCQLATNFCDGIARSFGMRSHRWPNTSRW